ncbi:MAG: tRNA1(Val) (adenine(37)-N6)-methyltransferase [Hyphomicrobiaceae bacterium]
MSDEPQITDDAFLGGQLHILQPAEGYRAGLDAVLLAATLTPLTGEGATRVLDAGAGVGVVGLAIARRLSQAIVTLVEREPLLLDLAERNVARNGLSDRVRVIGADISAGGAALHGRSRDGSDGDGALAPGSFEHLVCNPPYHATGAGTRSALQRKARAHHMPEAALDRWLAFLATAGTSGARLSLIHRADALGRVLEAIGSRFGRVRIMPVHPKARLPANRILVEAVKGSRAPLEIRPGLVLQEHDGRYRPEIEAVLREGAPLAL